MASLTDLGGAATQLLQLMTEQLVALDIELPCAQYVAPGAIPAWDGEQLVVNLQRIEQGQPGAPEGGTSYRATFAATFGVSIVREVAALHGDGQAASMLPTADAIQVDGVSAFDDAAALILSATRIHEGYLFAGPGEGFNIGPCTAIGPQGGLAGHQLLVTVSLS